MTQIASLPSPATFRKDGKDYRRWTKAHKRQIVEETFLPGASVSVVARQHDVNANQVFKWRLEYQRGELDEGKGASAGFVPVTVVEPNGAGTTLPVMPGRAPASPACPGASVAPVKRKLRTDILQLELRNGVKLKLCAGIDPVSLRQMLSVIREVL